MTRLFVYGTLKRGGRNVHLMAGGECRGAAATAPRYALVELGTHPGLVPGELAVRGEVWDVPVDTLARLDAFEEVPYPFDRRPVELEDGSAAEAYFWLGAATGEQFEVWGERPA